MSEPVVALLAGGVSGEREVSFRSAEAVAIALRRDFQVEFHQVDEEAVPEAVDPGRHVVFSTLHGIFGEDGGMQTLLDRRGVPYAGSDAASSRLCMNKTDTKRRVAEGGVTAPRGLCFDAGEPPEIGRLIDELGPRIVLKPNGEGSSIGLHFAEGRDELAALVRTLDQGAWLAEERIHGRELTIGVLDGRAMGVVEIIPDSGRYDYESKYTRGRTQYRFPAEIPESATAALRRSAETAFALCGCRDFARVDFILPERGAPRFLEINTLPGLTATSLLPKSAACEGFDFNELARRLIMPAFERFNFIEGRTGS